MTLFHYRVLILFIADLKRVVISYEIYETNEMTTSVRFYLSHDPLKWDFIASKMGNILRRKRIADTDVVMTLRLRAKVSLHVWSYDFYDTTLSTE